jgi:hypothetical protein
MMPKLGESVIYCDPRGVDHDALITAVWSETCVNVIFVSGDETKKDSYGRQIERQTSVIRGNPDWVHGSYWRFKDDPKLPYKPPVEV